jgi:hypothetical protein
MDDAFLVLEAAAQLEVIKYNDNYMLEFGSSVAVYMCLVSNS